jgi:hypothetical protein
MDSLASPFTESKDLVFARAPDLSFGAIPKSGKILSIGKIYTNDLNSLQPIEIYL